MSLMRMDVVLSATASTVLCHVKLLSRLQVAWFVLLMLCQLRPLANCLGNHIMMITLVMMMWLVPDMAVAQTRP